MSKGGENVKIHDSSKEQENILGLANNWSALSFDTVYCFQPLIGCFSWSVGIDCRVWTKWTNSRKIKDKQKTASLLC